MDIDSRCFNFVKVVCIQNWKLENWNFIHLFIGTLFTCYTRQTIHSDPAYDPTVLGASKTGDTFNRTTATGHTIN